MAEVFVKVGRVGGKVEEVCVDCRATVEDAIEAAGHSTDNVEIKKKTRGKANKIKLNARVRDGMEIIVVPKYKGGK